MIPVILISLIPGIDQRRADKISVTVFRRLQSLFLMLAGLTAGAVLFVLALWGYDTILHNTGRWVEWAIASVIGGSSVISLGSLRQMASLPAGLRSLIAHVVFAVAGYVFLGVGLVAWYYFLWFGWAGVNWDGFSPGGSSLGILFYITLALSLGSFILTYFVGHDLLNFFSLSRLYVQRIQRTWVVAPTPESTGQTQEATKKPRGMSVDRMFPKGDPENAESDGWTRTWVRPDIRVSGLVDSTGGNPTAPYHLICTALNIPGSTNPQLLGRKSESFVIAPCCSGSALTRWSRTEDLEDFDRMSLSQAAEISAAAVSPNMGMFTTTTLSIVTTLFNARSGRWVRNPHPSSTWRRWITRGPMLYWKEMFGMASQKDPYIYLSDGGHFENLGIYELLRRRCKYIIAVDGSGENSDPTDMLQFGGLGIPIRQARIDFGVLIDIDLQPLMRDPETGMVRSHFAVGRIRYPRSNGQGHGESRPSDPDTGILVFIKAGRVDGAFQPDQINYLRAVNPDFPHDSTADQQFDEAQFESYRELGFLAGMSVARATKAADPIEKRFKSLDTYYHNKILK